MVKYPVLGYSFIFGIIPDLQYITAGSFSVSIRTDCLPDRFHRIICAVHNDQGDEKDQGQNPGCEQKSPQYRVLRSDVEKDLDPPVNQGNNGYQHQDDQGNNEQVIMSRIERTSGKNGEGRCRSRSGNDRKYW